MIFQRMLDSVILKSELRGGLLYLDEGEYLRKQPIQKNNPASM